MAEETKINGNRILDDIRYSTTKLIVKKSGGGESIGTGFFCYLNADVENKWPLLVTNKHMVEDWESVAFKIIKADSDGNPIVGDSEDFLISKGCGYEWLVHSIYDLSVFPILPILKKKELEAGVKMYCKFIQEELIPNETTLPLISSIENI